MTKSVRVPEESVVPLALPFREPADCLVLAEQGVDGFGLPVGPASPPPREAG